MKKFIYYLDEAQKIIRACDHMLYVSYPLVKDKHLVIKILKELKKALAYLINAILQCEYLFKKIKLYKDPKENFKTFKEKSAKRFTITQKEIQEIQELFELTELHGKSPMAFTRDEKIIILSDSLTHKTVTIEKTKAFVHLAKTILKKTQDNLKKHL